MTSPRVSVIIPAYNEADRIGATVRAAGRIPGVHEIIVVDDGSSDGTAERAREAGATTVIRSERNEGKGGAMNRGWAAASGEIGLFLDGDLGESAGEAAKLLEPILDGAADVTLARFPASGRKGGFGFVMRLARWGVRWLGGQDVSTPLSGQRAMRRAVIERLGGFTRGYSVETAMTIDLLRAGCRLIEVPTAMTHKATGRDVAGFLHRGRQFGQIAAVLLRKAAERPKARR